MQKVLEAEVVLMRTCISYPVLNSELFSPPLLLLLLVMADTSITQELTNTIA